jgi:hypothetical protein
MNVDNALANCKLIMILQRGDTGRRRAEHRNFLQLRFTHHYCKV